MNKKRLNARVSGSFPRETPRPCVKCQIQQRYVLPGMKERIARLLEIGVSIPKSVSFQVTVLFNQDMPGDGTQVYFIGEDEDEDTYAWFLRERYQCGYCSEMTRTLTLVSAGVANHLYSICTTEGSVEIEIAEVTRKQMVHCQYKPGSSAYKVVEYLRSMAEHVGYRRLD